MPDLPSPDKKLSRRDFLKYVTGLALFLFGCVPSDDELEDKSRHKISQTATAMSPKSAEQVLKENNAPPEVFTRTVNIQLDIGKIIIQGSGLILETTIINDRNFALIATAGHLFTDEKKIPTNIISIHLNQPQKNDQDLVNDPKTPVFDTNFVFDKEQDFGFLLVEIQPDLHFSPLKIAVKHPRQNLYGLGFPTAKTDQINSTELIPYVVSPYQIKSLPNDFITLDQSSSDGASGIVLLNQKSEAVTILVASQLLPVRTICNPFPADFSLRRQEMLDNMTAKLHQPTPAP